MADRRSFDRRLSFAVVSLLLLVAGCATPGPEGRAASRAAGPCLLIDTDAALDDLRAIAAVAPQARLVAVVATEGISSPAKGAMGVAHLLAGASPRTPVPVIVGAVSAAPSTETWLPEARANAERLNGFLVEAVAVADSAPALEDAVAEAVASCGEVRALVTGPWTSFVRYQPRLGARLRQVVTQGLPLEDVPAGRAPGFNCRYDLAACRQVHGGLRPARLGVWVDVPRNVTPAYAPTAEMVAQLRPTGLPGTLRAVMLANPTGWKDTLMWDDSAALYLLHPEAFGPKGAHVEPTVPPDEFRRLWLAAANRGA